MTIAVHCPSCRKAYRIKGQLAGRKATCQACGTAFRIPASQPAASSHESDKRPIADKAPTGPRCPACGVAMGARSVLCVECGHDLRTGKKLSQKVSVAAAAEPHSTEKERSGAWVVRGEKIRGYFIMTVGVLAGVALLIVAICWIWGWLGTFHEGRSAAAWVELLDANNKASARDAQDALAELGPRAVPALLSGLNHDSPDVRVAVVQLLGRLSSSDDRIVGRLTDGLQDQEYRVRFTCINVLGELGPDARDAVPALMQLSADAHPQTRTVVLEALGKIGDPQAVPLLKRCLSTEESECQIAAIRALGAIGPQAKEAVPDLVVLFQTEKDPIRRFSVETLGQIGPHAKAAVPALTAALTDIEQIAVAAKTLGQIGPNAASAVPALVDVRSRINEIMSYTIRVAHVEIHYRRSGRVLVRTATLYERDYQGRSAPESVPAGIDAELKRLRKQEGFAKYKVKMYYEHDYQRYKHPLSPPGARIEQLPASVQTRIEAEIERRQEQQDSARQTIDEALQKIRGK